MSQHLLCLCLPRLTVLVLATSCVAAEITTLEEGLPVLPGGQGFGMTTPAGRGGAIHRVTTLDDAGAGSLRAALEASGPRVIVFEVAGIIDLLDNISINDPFVTVAGQTAPSPGITLRGGGIKVFTHDVLIQHIRIRPGDGVVGATPTARDALSIGEGGFSVVVDHVSASWGVDENLSVSAASDAASFPRDVTISACIISEGLDQSIHPEGPHSKGSLIRRSGDVALVGNLFAHNVDRNPEVKGGAHLVFLNNVVYDAVDRTVYFSDSDDIGPITASVVGNVIMRGPSTPSSGWYPIWIRDNMKPGTRIYVEDNEAPGRTSDPWSVVEIDAGLGFNPRATTRPLWHASLTARSSGETQTWVLATAGARPADRDAVDTRIVSEVQAGTGGVIDSPSDVGGYPGGGPVVRGLTPPASPDGDDDGDGYTNLEEWLHQFAAAVEGRGSLPPAPQCCRNLKPGERS